jgi:diguanylate cyclase (GGDEF)-like protein
VTDRPRTERGEQTRLTLIEQSVDVLATFDATGMCRTLSPRARQTIGMNPEQVDLATLFAADEHQFIGSVLPGLLATGTWSGEIAVRAAHGPVHLDARLAADRSADGRVHGWTLVAHDVTATKALHAELVHRATHDALTGIPNRAHLVDCLDVMIADDEAVTVVYLDLDGFKAVNDSHGHDVGDRALVEIAGRLQRLMTDGGVAARLGGDEFVVIPPASWDDPVTELREGVFADPIVVDDDVLELGARFGIALSRPAESAQALLVRADQAMYRAKRAAGRR